MFCPNCGTQNTETAQTCTKCTFNLKGGAAPKFKGTMLMMNQPGAAKPGTPPAAPKKVPTPPPGPAVASKLKGTMVGVAPPNPGAAPRPPSVPPMAPRPPSVPPPDHQAFGQQGVNPLGGTMAVDPGGLGAFVPPPAQGFGPPAGAPFGAPPQPGADAPAFGPSGSAPPPGFGAGGPGGQFAPPDQGWGAPPGGAPGGFGGPPPGGAPGGFGGPPPGGAPGGFGGPPPGGAPGGFGGPPPGGAPGGFGAPPPGDPNAFNPQGGPPPQDFNQQMNQGFQQAGAAFGQAANEMGNAYNQGMAPYGGGPMMQGQPGMPGMMQPQGAGAPKPFMLTLILCILPAAFGVCGIHRFFTGHVGIGIAQFLTLGGCGLWQLYDIIMIITGKYTDKNGQPLLKT